MPWLRLPDGRQRFARPGSQTEVRWLRRGAKPAGNARNLTGRPEHVVSGDVANKPVKVLLAEASDADLDTIERLLHEEYAGPNRKSALEGLERLRRQRQE